MAALFPTKLPDRPQKASKPTLTKRLTQRLTIQIATRKKSVAVSLPIASEDYILHPIATNVTYPHVLTSQLTSPAPFGVAAESSQEESRRGPGSQQSERPNSSPSRSPASASLADPCQSSYSALCFEQPRAAPFPMKINRKKLSPPAFEGVVNDQFIERCKRLRLPQSEKLHTTPTAVAALGLLPRINVNISPPLPSHHYSTAAAAKLAWNKMAVPNPNLPARREEPQLRAERQNTNPYRQTLPGIGSDATRPIATNDESEDEVFVVSEHPTNPFSKTNFFQSRGRRQSRYRTTPTRQRNERRSRSPGGFSSDSEEELTPESSDASYPDLTALIAQAETKNPKTISSPLESPPAPGQETITHQEEQDRRLAQRLQQEENDANNTDQSLCFEELRSAARHQKSTPPISAFCQKSSFSNLKQTIARHGTRENPIDLGSDSDSSPSGADVETRSPVQDYGAFYEEPMALDDIESDLDGEGLISNIREDAKIARLLQAEENSSRQAPSGSRDCAVCGESTLIIELPSLADCTHQPETCTDCYTEWITTQLRHSSWREVKCPGTECKVLLTYYEIKQFATPDLFQQYDTYIARAALNEDPNFRWCRACDFGQIHLSGVEGNIFTCASCRQKVCIIHENTWHEGETCGEYEYRSSGRKEHDQKAQEEASLQAIGKLSKKCPGPNCVYNIEKNDGCDHMTCSKCRYEFCWVCLCDYNKVRRLGNAAHTTACKYHTGRLP